MFRFMTALTGRRVLCSLTFPHFCKGIYYSLLHGKNLHRINHIPKNIRLHALAVLIPFMTPYDTLVRSIAMVSLINFLDHIFPAAFNRTRLVT